MWVRAYRSTSSRATGLGWVPTSEAMISGSSRWGASFAAAANFDENSPKLRCWLLRSMRPKVAASQKQVVPPLPRATTYPSGSENSSARPSRRLPTTDLTVFWRWLVPRYRPASAARASTASGRTLEGPEPNRPSAGRRWAGILMSGISVTYGIMAPWHSR